MVNKFLITSGLDKYFDTIVDSINLDKPYSISVDNIGTLVADTGYISTSSIKSRDFLESEVPKLVSEGVIEE